jgi:di/tricarboxylate transporter
LAPEPHTLLDTDDQLLVSGTLDRLEDLHGWSRLDIMPGPLAVQNLISEQVALAEIQFADDSSLLGKSVEEADFRRRYGLNVLAIWRDDEPLRSNLQNQPLLEEDILLVQVRRPALAELQAVTDFTIQLSETPEKFLLHERLLTIGIPDDSSLIGKTLAESRLGDAFDLTVLAVQRNGARQLIPEATDRLMAGDRLLVEGLSENVNLLMGLQDLLIDRESLPDFQVLETDQIGLVEVVLAPHASLFSKTLRQLHFREKYGLTVMAIWRSGQAYHTDLRNMALHFGDALLLFGRREKLRVLADEPDFLVLTEEIRAPPLVKKAPLAALIMLGVVISVLTGWLPISIAAVVGVSLMVLTGSLSMEEAYRTIDWRAVFLIAGMLPLGIAMETTGAARFLAELVVNGVGGYGGLALVAGIFILTSLSSQIMPNAVVVVLMAPIAINTAMDLQLSPYALMMVVAIAASASFLSPVGHPSNILVMGPGGYRFVDYIKVGLPLTVIVLIITLLALPIFWPLVP